MSTPFRVRIAGTGSELPERVITNAEIAARLDTSDEWIRQRTGIGQRRIADPGSSTTSYGARAAKKAMDAAGVGPDDIELVVFATVSPDYRLPFCAALLQRELGLTRAGGFDLTSGCAGFVQAAQVASEFIQGGSIETALVIGADLMSTLYNPDDRRTCVLFGDAAGAVVLRRSKDDEDSALLARTWGMKGDDESLIIKAGGGLHPITADNVDNPDRYVKMDGRAVYRFAVSRFAGQIEDACKMAGVTPDELKLVFPHQVNMRILETASRKVGLPLERVVTNLEEFANCAGASVPLVFDTAVRQGRLERGDLILMVAFGSGLAWASTLFRY